jgi:transposase
MRIVGCDLHASQQTIAMLDRDTGEISERIIKHEGTAVRDFYAGLVPPILVGIEATGSMGWFLRLMEGLGITCRVGDPARIRAVETRRGLVESRRPGDAGGAAAAAAHRCPPIRAASAP